MQLVRKRGFAALCALTVGVNATEQVLVQAHLVKGVEGPLPVGEELVLVVAHAAKGGGGRGKVMGDKKGAAIEHKKHS